ncbi:MAG: hypothetical protein GXO74_12320 [Calditrichaeota bacterium]|nr:hypothetical protein [Calditrichota bacterium]
MRPRIFFLLILFQLMLGVSGNLFGQYWGEMVLEKSFEQENFFFTPTELKPYGLSTYASVAPGLFSDPLLNLSLNPSWAWQDSGQDIYVYADFRSIHNLQDNRYGIIPAYDYAALRADANDFFPFYYSEPRRETLPFFAGALLLRPIKIWGSKPLFGVTYRMIFQDEDYYAIPFDIYRSAIGMDYSGNRYLDENSMPVIDRYRGENRMNQTGHFLSLFSAVGLTKWLDLGFRVNRTTFNRDGKIGSHNFWPGNNEPSLWEDWEWRTQNYDHWDFSGAFSVKLKDDIRLGGKIGYLQGDVSQILGTSDSSYYSWGQINQGENWSLYNRSGASSKSWAHDGKTYYGGIDFRFRLSPSLTSVFYFLHEQADGDVSLKANISDSSYSNYHSVWEQNTWDNVYSYSLEDRRTGSGTKTRVRNLFSWFFQWQMDGSKALNFGLQLENQDRRTKTSERVWADRFSHNSYSNTNPDYSNGEFFNAVTEVKELDWDFRARRTDVRIPVIFNWRVSHAVDLIFGINRTMSRWTIDDETLAKFDYRVTTTDTSTVRKENFAERYREPQEKRTQIQTTMMAGITFRPSENLSVRLLTVPRFENRYSGSELSHLEWWLSLNFAK